MESKTPIVLSDKTPMQWLIMQIEIGLSQVKDKTLFSYEASNAILKECYKLLPVEKQWAAENFNTGYGFAKNTAPDFPQFYSQFEKE